MELDVQLELQKATMPASLEGKKFPTNILVSSIVFYGRRLAPQTNIPPPGLSMMTVQGVHLILKRRIPLWMCSQIFLLGGWPP